MRGHINSVIQKQDLQFDATNVDIIIFIIWAYCLQFSLYRAYKYAGTIWKLILICTMYLSVAVVENTKMYTSIR